MAIDQYGQIIRRGPSPITIRTNPNVRPNSYIPPASTSHYNPSRWNRFDNFIGSIGNWFASSAETITGVIVIILLACMAIPFIIWLFSLGLFWGIVAGVLLGGICYYAAMIVVGIFIWISNICLAAIRYIFYSGTTFLITLAVAGALMCYGFYASSQSSFQYSPCTESEVSTTTKYSCTATVLNVRSMPNSSAPVIGSLKRNQVVEVYEITNGFAKIKYNSEVGYASIKYLNQSTNY